MYALTVNTLPTLGTCVYFTVSFGITGIPFGNLVIPLALAFERVYAFVINPLARGKNRTQTIVAAAIVE